MRLYVCGDSHSPIDLHKLSTDQWPEQKELHEEDVLAILGDFGGLWLDKSSREEIYWLKWLTAKNCTVCFVDGNHENFNVINKLEEVDFCDAKAGLAFRDDNGSILHLKRGEIYTMEHQTILTFGGALSVDKHLRMLDRSWWEGELPTHEDVVNLDKNLELHNNKVDFILTHTAPKSKIIPMGLISSRMASMFGGKLDDPTTEILQSVLETVEFKQWHFGHFHKVRDFENRFFCHYNNRPMRLI
ncbi:metallophosphoesterase [bacterium]|nr:metallophosphoesterase [bacterium]